MKEVLFSTPVAFAVMLIVVLWLSFILSRLSLRRKSTAKGLEPYACGEDGYETMVQPNYGEFIPFAFFFTIMHVVALIVASAPMGDASTVAVIAIVYVASAITGLRVLYAS
jgi:NADH:ubiquinone oxidoreductase subunit 3 (subunit A)